MAFAETDEIRVLGKRREIPTVESAILLELDGENGVDGVGHASSEPVDVGLEDLDCTGITSARST